jgi:hypothetical protein
MTSSRSIWSQAASEFPPIEPIFGTAGDAVLHEPGNLRLAGLGAVAAPPPPGVLVIGSDEVAE